MNRDLDAIRRAVLLPSDCLEIARLKNPSLKIDLVDVITYANDGTIGSRVVGSKFQLQVDTGRGVLKYDKGAGEKWAAVFKRAGLLS